MAKQRDPLDFDAVREIALALPGIEERTTSRGASLKAAGRMLACPAVHGSAEPNTLMVRVSIDERERMLATEPRTYYLTEHYAGYPAILVRLSRISRDSLRELLANASRQLSDKARKRKRPARSRS
jgi:hypothetical protein